MKMSLSILSLSLFSLSLSLYLYLCILSQYLSISLSSRSLTISPPFSLCFFYIPLSACVSRLSIPLYLFVPIYNYISDPSFLLKAPHFRHVE
uniref:Uncharacterized protein n=1 Tax=Arundo donax TaxID=35708 RepID=A0A0A9GF14_ARUDO